MKIVFLIDRMNGFGGAQRVASVLCNQFAKKNNVLILLTGEEKKSVYNLNSQINIYCCGRISKLKKIILIRKKIKEFQADIVISFLTMVNIYKILSLLRTKIPLIISERNDPDRCTKNEKILSKILYNFSTAAVVQTNEIKRKLKKFYKKEIYVIQNPIIETNYEKINYEKYNKIVAVGRLNEQKNYPLMIEAFSYFIEKYPQYELLIYGIGDKEKYLKDICKKNKLENKVLFKGNVSNVLEREIETDFFIMTSNFEGMPNALAEAMAIGMPCIATNCDGRGAAELINNGVNGILIEKGNLTELIKAMYLLTENIEYRKQIAKEAKKIKIKLSCEEIGNKWLEYIEFILKKGK